MFYCRFKSVEQEEWEGAGSLSELSGKEIVRKREKEEEEDVDGYSSVSASPVIREKEETSVEKGAELSELEMELQREEEIRLLHEQDCLLQQVIVLK